MRRTPRRLVRRRLRVPRDLPHPPARWQLILQPIRVAQRLRLRSLQRLHLRLLLQPPLHVRASRLQHLRRDPACRCGLQQHREARLLEHVLRQRRLGLLVLPAHLQLCNAIPRVRERLVVRQDKRVQVRRKACARLVERRNNIVRAVRRRAVLVVRPGSVRADRLRDSRNVLAAVVDRVAAIIRDQ